jgi:polyisoprenoid-binding protein YceI
MKSMVVGLVLILFANIVHAADTYLVDKGHSNVGFTVQHVVINKVSGRFKDFTGIIQYDPNDPAQCSVSGTIQAASIDTANPDRDSDLKGEDWFEVEKYPEIKFQSKKVEKRGETYLVSGTLTMHGVTREIQMPVTVTGPIKAMGGKMRIGIEMHFTINRRDYELVWNNAVEGVGLIAANEVTININAEGVKQEGPQTQQ